MNKDNFTTQEEFISLKKRQEIQQWINNLTLDNNQAPNPKNKHNDGKKRYRIWKMKKKEEKKDGAISLTCPCRIS